MAGTAAAVAAAAAGARTVLISARPGATALCSGAWLGHMPRPFVERLAAEDYVVTPAPERLPWPDGRLLAFDECESAHAIVWGARALVCGIVGVPTFPAAVLVDLWRDRIPAALSSITIEMPGTPVAGWAPASLARLIERNPVAFCDAVAAHVRRTGADALVVPTLFGLEAAGRTRSAIGDRLGVRVFEAPGGTPSLAGWRLWRALGACLSRADVSVIEGAVTGFASVGGRVTEISVAGQSSEHRLTARTFVLATGKFLGGGITADATFRESVFGLPVRVEHLGERFDRVEPLALTNAERSAHQPLLTAGVATDSSGRPIDPAGTVVLDNVLVAGVVRAGIEGGAMNLGNVAADGWAAGERAAA